MKTFLRLLATASLLAAAPSWAQSQQVRPDPEEQLQWSASVVKLDELKRQGDLGGKLFGTAGGDPAMNGLYTYLAFFDSTPEGWRIFRLGDFLDYRIVAERPGQVTLAVTENYMDERRGEIRSRPRRLVVSWQSRGRALPASVSVNLSPLAR